MSDQYIKLNGDNTLFFGDYKVLEKKKVDNYDVAGDLYKIKTCAEVTKLEKNGRLLYESLPGSAVDKFKMDDKVTTFTVIAVEDLQITMELIPDMEYKLFVDGVNIGKFKTNLSGKLSFGLEMEGKAVGVKIEKV